MAYASVTGTIVIRTAGRTTTIDLDDRCVYPYNVASYTRRLRRQLRKAMK